MCLFDAQKLPRALEKRIGLLESNRAKDEATFANLVSFRNDAESVAVVAGGQTAIVCQATALLMILRQEFDVVGITGCVAANAGFEHVIRHDVLYVICDMGSRRYCSTFGIG